MRLWDKGKTTDSGIMAFTAGMDRVLDQQIAWADVLATMAHVEMLASVKLLSHDEMRDLIKVLLEIDESISAGKFVIGEGMEDVHTMVEYLLTRQLGETGKKVHTARSRNDQVLTDLKLYYRHEICNIAGMVRDLSMLLLKLSEDNKELLIPGYTHFQAAMPSSFGLWFGAYAEALAEDLGGMKAAMDYINHCPLGSAAGYGSNFPVNRDMTASRLEFDGLHVNSMNAQLSRGKSEKMLLSAIGMVAGTLAKMSMDLVLFMSQNFGFVGLSDDLTTGSSIMPHKKNPDVLELIRAKCNRLQAREFELSAVIINLPSGYHRDFQLLKEMVFPALTEIQDCIQMMGFVCERLVLNRNIMDSDKYRYISSVEAINEKVQEGIPFREAYTLVASEIDKGRFRPVRGTVYTHAGSIGNLSNDRILQKLELNFGALKTEKYKGFEKRIRDHFKQILK